MSNSFPELGNLTPGDRITLISGAGVSAESGLKTFRDNDGLWESHSVYEVATPEAWQRNPELVLRFYNERRRQLRQAEPNDAHRLIASLEEHFRVEVVTQNVDDLHEKAGSSRVCHLHGELIKVRSSVDEELVYDCPGDLKLGDYCEKGSQLRPHVVWFGEMVPMIEEAARLVAAADLLVVVGTSLQVYPAAGLINVAHPSVPIVVIDPAEMPLEGYPRAIHWRCSASAGMKRLSDKLLETI